MDNLDIFKTRAHYANNDRQHNRMVEDKKRSLQRALLYSYQTATIKKDEENAEWCRALINPDRVKFDYDEKIISIEWEYNFKAGDSFEWPKDSGVHWLILKQELTELSYFRGNIRRCQYISTIDPDTKETVGIWAAVRGPVETKINTIQKSGIVADVPNLTLDIYMKCTDQTIKLFDRYRRFEFMGKFWKVSAPDWISTPNILEITAVEDYDCDHSDFTMDVVDPNPAPEPNKMIIEGETFVKPLSSCVYTIDVPNPDYDWIITLPQSKKLLSDVLEYVISPDKSTIKITWTAMTSGSYILTYGDLTKTVVVESLF